MRSWEKDGKKVVAVNFSIPLDALEILRRYSPGGKAYGGFVARLLFEHEARTQERQRLLNHLQSVVGDDAA
jgi:hypothetical protein